jgi:putative nucleotidyltransferase with HDIG domain
MFELKKYLGCLAHKRTPDEAAWRRIPPELDEDQWMMLPGQSFSVDALGKITMSKAFRRLGAKTQVLTRMINAHARKRLTHTFEVANVATLIAKVLGLNEDLCRAIAYGHDIGHAPFGHPGEVFISEITGKEFRHATFGLVIAQHIERRGEGLNLTHQVLEGILVHSRGEDTLPETKKGEISEEAKVVKYSDKISFTLADIDDVFRRTRVLSFRTFPEIDRLLYICGEHQRERLAFCVDGLCRESAEKGYVSFEMSEPAKVFAELKSNMDKVYNLVNLQNSAEILGRVHSFLAKTELIERVNPAIVLALMTDDDVLYLYGKGCINPEDFYDCSVAEIVKHLKDKDIDFSNPDLDW